VEAPPDYPTSEPCQPRICVQEQISLRNDEQQVDENVNVAKNPTLLADEKPLRQNSDISDKPNNKLVKK